MFIAVKSIVICVLKKTKSWVSLYCNNLFLFLGQEEILPPVFL